MSQNFIGRDMIGMRPRIQAADTDQHGNEQHDQYRKRAAGRFEDPPEDTPHAARQMLDHDHRHRSQSDAQKQQICHEPRTEKLVAIDEQSKAAQDEADNASDERT
jgi:hypothetical protein